MKMPKKLRQTITQKIKTSSEVSMTTNGIFIGDVLDRDKIQITRHNTGCVSIKVRHNSILYEVGDGVFEFWTNGVMLNLVKR